MGGIQAFHLIYINKDSILNDIILTNGDKISNIIYYIIKINKKQVSENTFINEQFVKDITLYNILLKKEFTVMIDVVQTSEFISTISLEFSTIPVIKEVILTKELLNNSKEIDNTKISLAGYLGLEIHDIIIASKVNNKVYFLEGLESISVLLKRKQCNLIAYNLSANICKELNFENYREKDEDIKLGFKADEINTAYYLQNYKDEKNNLNILNSVKNENISNYDNSIKDYGLFYDEVVKYSQDQINKSINNSNNIIQDTNNNIIENNNKSIDLEDNNKSEIKLNNNLQENENHMLINNCKKEILINNEINTKITNVNEQILVKDSVLESNELSLYNYQESFYTTIISKNKELQTDLLDTNLYINNKNSLKSKPINNNENPILNDEDKIINNLTECKVSVDDNTLLNSSKQESKTFEASDSKIYINQNNCNNENNEYDMVNLNFSNYKFKLSDVDNLLNNITDEDYKILNPKSKNNKTLNNNECYNFKNSNLFKLIDKNTKKTEHSQNILENIKSFKFNEINIFSVFNIK